MLPPVLGVSYYEVPGEGEAPSPGCLLSRTIEKKGVLGSECLLPYSIHNLGKSSTSLNMLAANRTN